MKEIILSILMILSVAISADDGIIKNGKQCGWSGECASGVCDSIKNICRANKKKNNEKCGRDGADDCESGICTRPKAYANEFRCLAERHADGVPCSFSTECESKRCADSDGMDTTKKKCGIIRVNGQACSEDIECESNHCGADSSGSISNRCQKKPRY